jgi:hypothetical protein
LIWLLLSAFVCLQAAPASASVPPSRGVPLIPRVNGHIPAGFNDVTYISNGLHEPIPDDALRTNLGWYRGFHAGLARLTIRWDMVQPTLTQPRSFWWDYYDQILNNWIDSGIPVVVTIADAPAWARSPADLCSGHCPPGSAYLDEWSAFAAAVAARYPGLAAIEVWNEPNLRVFWQTLAGPNVNRYDQVLQAAYDGVKSADPSLPVLGGGLGNNEVTQPLAKNVSLHDFLNGMLADGASAFMDGLSFHAYDLGDNPTTDSGGDSLFTRTVDRNVKGVLANYNVGGQPLNGRIHLWVTEMGASTTGTSERGGAWCLQPAPAHRCSPQEQSDDLRADYDLLDRYPDVDAMVVHTLQDLPNSGSAQGFGLIASAPSMNSPAGTAFTYKCAYANMAYYLQGLGFPGTPVSGPASC